MARMDRPVFQAVTARLWQAAQRNLTDDGQLQQVLLGIDSRAQVVLTVLGVNAETLADPAERARAENGNLSLFESPLTDRTDEILALVRGRNVVAAVYIAEMWMVAEGAARDVLATGMLPSEHPGRVECVQLTGVFPQQVTTVTLAGLIVRDGRGRPVLAPWSDQEAPALSARWVEGWLTSLLPGLPGRRPGRR